MSLRRQLVCDLSSSEDDDNRDSENDIQHVEDDEEEEEEDLPVTRNKRPATEISVAAYEENLAHEINRNLGISIGSVWNPQLRTMYREDWVRGDPQQNMGKILSNEPDARSIFNIFSQTIIFKASMRPRTTRFNGFRTGEVNGYCDYLAFMFGLKAFTNPIYGSDPCGSMLDNGFVVENEHVRFILSKTLVYFEPLVKIFYPNDPIKTFDVDNVVGFRVWYLIQDPEFDPLAAVEQTITELKFMSGDTADFKYFNEEEAPYAERLASVELGGPAHKALLTQMSQRNRELRDIRAKIVKNNECHRREAKLNSNRPEFFLCDSIRSNADYYRYIQYHLKRCHFCAKSMSGICGECILKGDNLLTYNYPDHFGPDGQPLDIEEVINRIRWVPLLPSHEAAIAMNLLEWRQPIQNANARNDNWLMLMTLDPNLGYGSPFSKKNKEILRRAGVCEGQCKRKNYNSNCNLTGRQIYTFFNTQLLFDFFPKNIRNFDEFISNTEFPWKFQASDLMLAVARANVQGTMHDRQVEYSKHLCTKIAKTLTFDKAIQRSTFYDPYFEDVEANEYFRSDPLTAASFPGGHNPIAEELEQRDPNVVLETVEDDADKYFKESSRRLRELNELKPMIPEEIHNKILDAIQAEGVVAFGTIFHSGNPNITQLQRAAAHTIEQACDPTTRFHYYEIQTVDVKLGYDASYMLSIMFMLASFDRDIIDNHIVGLQILHAIYRASHSSALEQLIKAIDTVPNYINQGTAATGKSNFMKVIALMLLSGTMCNISTQSTRANAIAVKMQGLAIISDEIGPHNDAFLASIRGDLGPIVQMKEAITNFLTTHKALHLDEEGNRLVKEIETKWHTCFVTNANTLRTTPGENSFYSRWLINWFIANQIIRKGEETTTAGSIFAMTPTSIDDVSLNGNAMRVKWMQLAHALHVQAALAEQLGALPYPNMSMLGIIFGLVEQHMLKRFPGFSENSRRIACIHGQVKAKVIARAIQLVWTSELSPFIKVNPDGSLSTRPMDRNSIMMIAPYLQATEDICIFEITAMVLQHLIPSKIWLTVARIARRFCGYGTQPNYAKRTDAAQNPIEDRNYLQTTATYEQILAEATKWGYNEHVLTEMLTSMENFQIIAQPIDYNDQTHTTLRPREKISAIKVINHPSLHVQAAVNSSVSKPLAIEGVCKLQISVEYLERCSPQAVLKYMMKSLEHAHTRERTVLVGDSLPGYPQFLATYDLKRDPTRVAKVSNNCFRDPVIANHILPDAGVSFTLNSMNKSMQRNKRDIVITGDIEEMVMLSWLETNKKFLPPAHRDSRFFRYYLPRHYNEEIRERRAFWPIYNKSTVNSNDYPHNCVKETLYTELLHVGHPILSEYSNNSPQFVETPPAGPVELDIPDDPFYDAATNLVIQQRMAEATASSSSSGKTPIQVPQSQANIISQTPARSRQ